MITTISVTTASGAGALAEGIAARIGCAGYGAGSVVTALATLWIMDKLNNLVDRGN